MRDRVTLFKSRGIVSIRSEIFTLYRQLRVADEEGLLVSVLAATGGRGPNRDYLWNTAAHLHDLGIADPELDWLAERVRALASPL